MTTEDILKQALKLDPAKRFELAEGILHSLDQPDPAIDAVWIDEAKRRLAAYRAGKAKAIPIEDVEADPIFHDPLAAFPDHPQPLLG